MFIDGPIRREVAGGGGGFSSRLVVTNFLVITKQIIPLVIALVLASQAATAPAIVLHPLPPQLAASSAGNTCSTGFGGFLRGGAGSSEPTLVVELLGSDEDQGLLNGPVAFAVFPDQGGVGDGGGGWGGGGASVDEGQMEGLTVRVR